MRCQAMCKRRRKQDSHQYNHNDYDFLIRLINCAVISKAQHNTVQPTKTFSLARVTEVHRCE